MRGSQTRRAIYSVYRRCHKDLRRIPGVVAVGVGAERQIRFRPGKLPSRSTTRHILITVRTSADLRTVQNVAERILGSMRGVAYEVASEGPGIG